METNIKVHLKHGLL